MRTSCTKAFYPWPYTSGHRWIDHPLCLYMFINFDMVPPFKVASGRHSQQIGNKFPTTNCRSVASLLSTLLRRLATLSQHPQHVVRVGTSSTLATCCGSTTCCQSTWVHLLRVLTTVVSVLWKGCVLTWGCCCQCSTTCCECVVNSTWGYLYGILVLWAVDHSVDCQLSTAL